MAHFPKPALSNVVFLKGQYWVLFFSYDTLMTCQIACRILILECMLMTHILRMLIAMWTPFNLVSTKICKTSANGELQTNLHWMTKTEFMLIGSRQKLSTLTATPFLTINGTPINQVPTSKSLGILIDSNLTWGSHIDKLAKKIASGSAAVKRVRQFVPSSTLHLIYKALIQPHFDYCSVVWGNCGIKISWQTSKAPKSCSTGPNFLKLWHWCYSTVWKIKLGKSLVSTQRDIQKAIMIFKSLNNLAPEYLASKFTSRSMTTPYTFRDSENKLAI